MLNLMIQTASEQLRILANCLEKVKWQGRDNFMACCPAHRDKSPSLKVSISPSGKLLWKCFAGCAQDQVGGIIRSLLGGAGGVLARQSRDIVMRGSLQHNAIAEAGTSPFIKRLIDEIWSETYLVYRGNVVDRYLTGRGIRLEQFPDDVRWHPKLAYYADRRSEDGKAILVGYYPAMVCAMRDADGDIKALHRTYLSQSGIKITDALPNHHLINKTRKVLGRTEGLVVRLGEADETLVVGEGIETCMAASLLAGHPAWSAYSASNLPNVVIPEWVKRVIIASDNDEAGRKAAAQLASRLINQKLVNVTAQFADGVGNDWADVLKGVNDEQSK